MSKRQINSVVSSICTKKKGTDEAKEESCIICQCTFTVAGDIGVGICCPGSHFMCSECTGVYISSVMGDLQDSFPPKCPICKIEIPMDLFEHQLTPCQLDLVRVQVAIFILRPGEKIQHCGICNYYEIRTDNPIIWRCSQCEEGLCLVCNTKIEFATEGDEINQRRLYRQMNDIFRHHLTTCAPLQEAKILFEEAINKGSKMCCPNPSYCGISGRKDDECTHMTCMKCSTVWCYVCGLSAADCDKGEPSSEDRPVDDIFLHNRDWETNEARCPMYLSQIPEVDSDWIYEHDEDEDEEDNQDEEETEMHLLGHFHRFQTIKYLQEVRNKIGNRKFLKLFDHFESISNGGFSIEDIINTDTSTLINREEWIRDLHNEERLVQRRLNEEIEY